MEVSNIPCKLKSQIKNNIKQSLGNHKKIRMIYSIDFNISKDELKDLIENSVIDCFYIDSSSFIDVKEYLKIIDSIREISENNNKYIGIIVELKCRKIKIELNSRSNNQKLKKGMKISLTSDKKQVSNYQQLIINTKDLHKMVKIGDKIILNENKASFTVHSINEVERLKSRTRRSSKEISFSDFKFNNGQQKKKMSFFPSLIKEMDSLVSKLNHSPDLKNYKEENYLDNDSDEKSIEFVLHEVSENQKNLPAKNLQSKFQSLTNGLEIIYDFSENNFTQKMLPETFTEQSDELTHKEVKNSIKFSNDFIISDDIKINNFKNSVPKNGKHRNQYEIICTVDYDCTVANQSFLYIPNLNYKEFDIDLLSTREIAEIELLEEKGIDYLSLTVLDKEDIQTLRDVLGDNPKLKFIFSIPDLRTLEHFDELLKFASGFILSRTFHINRNTNFQKDIIIIKNLVQKCFSFGKPVFSFLDLNRNLVMKRKQKLNEFKDVMNNVIDGIDGFVISIPAKDKRNIMEVNKILTTISDFFLELENDNLFQKEFLGSLRKNSNFDSLCDIISVTSQSFKECIILYCGDEIIDIEKISKSRYKAGLIALSWNTKFLNQCKLYYGFDTLKIEEFKCSKIKEDFIAKIFPTENKIVLSNLSGRINLQILSANF